MLLGNLKREAMPVCKLTVRVFTIVEFWFLLRPGTLVAADCASLVAGLLGKPLSAVQEAWHILILHIHFLSCKLPGSHNWSARKTFAG